LEIEESFGLSFAVSNLKLIPVVVRLHGPWFVNGKYGDPDYGNVLNSRREEFEGRGIRNAQTLTSPSANVIDAVKRHYGLAPSTETKVIPNPISSTPQDQTWSLENCCKDTLLFIGRIDKRKGADLVLLAFADLATRYPRLRLKLVGPDRGIENDKGQLLTYENFIRANIPESIRSRIHFFGPLSNSDLKAQRAKCFATIVASRYEIMPYSILEAMSFGCPLIATSVGGIPEMITDLHNGLLVPSEDLGAMIRACERLMNDPQLAAALGEQAWLDCRYLYNPERIAQQTAEVYGGAIQRFESEKFSF
jgi:glycosyltransferase involved in cell wall biosynthesis